MMYMLVNMVVQAWIIGSITLLIVKQDEKTGLYREALLRLDRYSDINSFDKKFHKRLKNAIKLSFETQEVADEEILHHFPTAVRRKVLRKLYLPALVRSSLMRGIRQQFVDAFLTICSVEIFSPGEEVLQRGNVSSDLYLLVCGAVELIPMDNSTVNSNDDYTSYHGTSVADSDHRTEHTSRFSKSLQRGDFINEISFFTETPQIDSVRTLGVAKTLTMSRSAYKLLCQEHPGSCGLILHNLLAKVKEMAEEAGTSESVPLPKPLAVLRAGSVFDSSNDVSCHGSDVQRCIASVQTKVALTTIQDLVTMHINKQKDDHTTRFLFAATRGDIPTITLMCDQGFDPNSADYDNRTALMLAAMKGNHEVVKKLLEFQCNPNLVDVHGSSALFEAARNGNETTVDELVKHNAELCMTESLAASTLCQLVFDGDTPTMRRLLLAKIQVNAADYDKRTAAHIAAAEGNMTALKVLVEFGADLTVKDRWNNSLEDEAKKAGNSQLVDYLKSMQAAGSSSM